MRPLPTLRQLLVLFALACVLPMAALSLAMVMHDYQRQRQQTEANTISTARALMAAVDDRFEGLERSLHGLSRSPALEAGDLAKLQEEAGVFQRSERAVNVLLLEAGGTELMNTRVPYGTPLPVATGPQILEAARRRQSMVLDLFRGPITGDYLLGVGIPVGQDRSLNANVAPLWLREVLVRQKLPPNWIASVLDRSGTIVARTHDHERFVGTRARAALIARIGEVPEDAVESTTVDGVPVITAFSRSTRSGFSVAIGIPRRDLDAPIFRSSLLLLAGTAGVLALTLWMAWRLARALGSSVESLGSAVRGTGHRAQLDLPPPVFQEAHQLGQTLLHAQAALQDATNALGRSESRLRSVVDSMCDAVVAADENGQVVLFNRAAEQLFHLSRDDALGRPLEPLLPPMLRRLHRDLREKPGGARRLAAERVVEAERSDGTRFRAEGVIAIVETHEEQLHIVILRPQEDTQPAPAA